MADYKKMTIDGKQYKTHRVMMEKHLGRPLEPNEVVHHKDEDRYHNEVGNLEVMLKRPHDILSGRTTLTGAKLKKSDIYAIRKMLGVKTPVWHIARVFGVSQQAISAIKNRKHWSWL